MPAMKTEQLILLAAVFAIVALFSFGLMALLMPNSIHRRLGKLTGDELNSAAATDGEEAQWVRKIAEASKPIAKLSIPKEGWENSALRKKFMHAGWRGASAPGIYFAAKTVLVIGLPLVCLVVAGPYLSNEKIVCFYCCCSCLRQSVTTCPIWCSRAGCSSASGPYLRTFPTRWICSRSAWKRASGWMRR